MAKEEISATQDLEVYQLLFVEMITDYAIKRLHEFTGICIDKGYLNSEQEREVFEELAKRDAATTKTKVADWTGTLS